MSINNDIRVRNNRSGRFLMLILGLAALALTISFAISLVPSKASAAGIPSWFHQNWNWHPHHNFNDYNDNSDQNDQAYAQCHNHEDDNDNNHIDLKDSACNDVDNTAPVAANQSLSTNENTALSGITLGATDADDDLLYFTVTIPSNGTVSVAATAFTQTSLPQVTYTPAPGFTGTDSFQYVVNDGRTADNATGTITIVVNPVCGDNQTLNTETNTCDNNAPVPASCSGDVGSTIIDVKQAVSNDPDSGDVQTWATDTFTKRMRVWAEGDHYCGQTDDNGTFVTNGTVSPEGVALPSTINGTFTGSARYVITGTLIAEPTWPTSGNVPANTCGGDGSTCPAGTYSQWVAQYFSGESHSFYFWHWTYIACGHGSWTNADVGNMNDIVEGPTAESCTVETPDTDTGSNGGSNGNGGGGAPISGPLSIGFVNNGGSNGGQVLGASTEAPMCSAYLSAYLKKGMKGDAVTKLQQFLNSHEGAKLTVNGIFDQATFNAVNAFQTKYSDEVLKPWFAKGFSKDMNPSGYVYKLTLYKINMIECASLNTPAPQLP